MNIVKLQEFVKAAQGKFPLTIYCHLPISLFNNLDVYQKIT